MNTPAPIEGAGVAVGPGLGARDQTATSAPPQRTACLPLLDRLCDEPLALLPIRTDGRLFEPDPDGREAAVVGVADYGPPYDAVSYFVDRPARWWLFRDTAVLLGERALRKASFEARPVQLVATPQRWVRKTAVEGDVCVVILDWEADLRLNLSWVSAIECESPALRRRLEATLARQAQPQFSITTKREAPSYAI